MTSIFGIRHHGPGCARSLRAALDALRPEVVVIELPQEAEPMLAHVADEGFEPPVAILFHQADEPERASYYPFAEFSPEWQALRWAAANRVPVRCFDLPIAHSLALEDEEKETAPRPDPFDALAEADGYTDGERWWNDRVEERRDDRDFFAAIAEAVGALRGDLALQESRHTLLREAWMRRVLRAVRKDHETVAVVCGAWHAPALEAKIKVADDNALLKGLPKRKVGATWIPWTYERLAMAGGYGAGVRAPGWYAHLWRHPQEPTVPWITRAARVLRKEGQEASSASAIEAVRLANSLAGLRGRPLPGLDETLEAIQSVFCAGDPLALDFLRRPLLVGERLGELPESLPALPLQQDIDATIRRLRMKKEASIKTLELDLREDGGRARSVFLHRLLALGVEWGKPRSARSRGTFKEAWQVQWRPELAVPILEASAFGNTVESAAASRLVRSLESDAALPEITRHLDLALLGDLPQAVEALLSRLDRAAAGASDVRELLAAVPPLARITRYGDVRATDVESVGRLLEVLQARIHAELVLAASGIDEDAAAGLARLVAEYRSAVSLLDVEAAEEALLDCMGRLASSGSAHPRLRGQATRFLRDAGRIDDGETARSLEFALSPGQDALDGAAWLEGFLQAGGAMLVHDHALLRLVDAWLCGLGDEKFQAVLPLVRRTFGSFKAPERSRISQAVRAGMPAPAAGIGSLGDLDLDRAMPAVAAAAKTLGLPEPS